MPRSSSHWEEYPRVWRSSFYLPHPNDKNSETKLRASRGLVPANQSVVSFCGDIPRERWPFHSSNTPSPHAPWGYCIHHGPPRSAFLVCIQSPGFSPQHKTPLPVLFQVRPLCFKLSLAHSRYVISIFWKKKKRSNEWKNSLHLQSEAVLPSPCLVLVYLSPTQCPVSGWMDGLDLLSVFLEIPSLPGRWQFPTQYEHTAFRTHWLHCLCEWKVWILVFMEPLSVGPSVPISIVTVDFEAPGRQAHCLSDSLFCIFLGNRKQTACGPAEWSWILGGRGCGMSRDGVRWVFSCLWGGRASHLATA